MLLFNIGGPYSVFVATDFNTSNVTIQPLTGEQALLLDNDFNTSNVTIQPYGACKGKYTHK